MSVESITDAIHECLYKNLNESPETEGEKVRHVEKKKPKLAKEQTDRLLKKKKVEIGLHQMQRTNLFQKARLSVKRKKMR